VPTALLFRVLGIAKSAERYSIRAIGARDVAGSRGAAPNRSRVTASWLLRPTIRRTMRAGEGARLAKGW